MYAVLAVTLLQVQVNPTELADALTSLSLTGWKLFNISASGDGFLYTFRKDVDNA